MIKLDGAYGEGGGQIVRTALGLSTLTGIPFEVDNIRKGRCDSGLKSQHVKCVEALIQFSGAKAEGASLGSTKMVFYPGKPESGTFSIDVGTAGSITLVAQSLLVPLVFGAGRARIRLTGGTDVAWSEPVDYFSEVLVPHLARFCESFEVSLEKRGYYPKGGGRMDFVVVPKFSVSDFSSFSDFRQFIRENSPRVDLVSRGDLAVVRGISHASADLQKALVAERQASSAKRALSVLGCPIRIDASYSDTLSAGSGICIWAVFTNKEGEIDRVNPQILGADSLGERSKRAEDVGKEASEALLVEITSMAPVDKFMADQLLPFMALCGGRMKVSEVTPHCLTNIYVIEQFLGKVFEVDEKNREIRTLF